MPGGGWPHAGLIEILPTCFGAGELALLLPVLAAVTRRPEARWCAWVAPPLQPFAPALARCGVAPERVLVVQARRNGRKSGAVKSGAVKSGVAKSDAAESVGAKFGGGEGSSALWAFEQTLRSGACDIALGWLRSALPRQIRRLHLAAEGGTTLGVLFRPREAALDSSPAALRVAVEPAAAGVRVTLLKSRGGARGTIDLPLR